MMKKNKPIPILVTGLGAATVGTQILKALRFAKTPYRIIGTDMSKESSGLQKVDVPYRVALIDWCPLLSEARRGNAGQ